MISKKRAMENHIANAPTFKVWSWMWPPDLVVGYQCLPLQDNRCDKTADMLSSQKWLEYLKVLWNWQATFANSTGPLPILTAQWRAAKIVVLHCAPDVPSSKDKKRRMEAQAIASEDGYKKPKNESEKKRKEKINKNELKTSPMWLREAQIHPQRPNQGHSTPNGKKEHKWNFFIFNFSQKTNISLEPHNIQVM